MLIDVAIKWSPVLDKCEDITTDQINGFAQILENQYNYDQFRSLTTYTSIQLLRKIWSNLYKAGVKIMPLEAPEFGINVRNDYVDVNNKLIAMSRVSNEAKCATACDKIANIYLDRIITLFNGRKAIYHPFLLFKHNEHKLTATHTWTHYE